MAEHLSRAVTVRVTVRPARVAAADRVDLVATALAAARA